MLIQLVTRDLDLVTGGQRALAARMGLHRKRRVLICSQLGLCRLLRQMWSLLAASSGDRSDRNEPTLRRRLRRVLELVFDWLQLGLVHVRQLVCVQFKVSVHIFLLAISLLLLALGLQFQLLYVQKLQILR